MGEDLLLHRSREAAGRGCLDRHRGACGGTGLFVHPIEEEHGPGGRLFAIRLRHELEAIARATARKTLCGTVFILDPVSARIVLDMPSRSPARSF